ncbi:MAG: bifunctional riboflavin kinase/FAD synthetase [Lachnospiraceae bacterium]|nr:bifunctional riboflavin kinase/FAD synthetase [Lachnospiraceae bacterium]MBQ8318237.1 bifunctional riboflavin kinase/FAD synthetase [Lachnospiraceae bacterium]
MNNLPYQEAQLHNTAVALGKFQGLHRGHLLLVDKILELAKNEGLTSTLFTININNSKMINTRLDREDILRELGVDVQVECDFSPEFASMRPYDFIKQVLYEKLGAKYVVVGTDFCFGYKRMGNVDTLLDYQEKFGYKVIAIDKLSLDGHIVSSSAIREFIQSGNIKQANLYMGRNYFIKGTVVEGKQLGRTLDFPTINQLPHEDKLLPPYGAYETRTIVDGRIYKSITNIGNNPTVSDKNNITIETHIIDYQGDLYGKIVKVEFINYIREQKRFHNVEELREQLILDKKYVGHQ